MNWIKKHADSVAVIAAIALGVYWMSHQVHDLEKRIDLKFSSASDSVNSRFNAVNERLNILEKDIAIIKTILLLNKSYPEALAIEKFED